MNKSSHRRTGAVAIALSCTVLATALAAWPSTGSAEGALAVGVPRNVAESGLAIGFSYNFATAQEASEAAMKRCRERGEETTPSIAGLCVQVGRTFRNQCAVIALDKEAGTPGYGWGIAPTKAKATEIALANCEALAGADRRGACEVTSTACDGEAQ
jgi:hypothetical protein